MPGWLGRMLCIIGIHDFRMVDVVMGFGPSGSIENWRCQRCGAKTTRGKN